MAILIFAGSYCPRTGKAILYGKNYPGRATEMTPYTQAEAEKIPASQRGTLLRTDEHEARGLPQRGPSSRAPMA